MKNRIYACIDLKSFYASVECAFRGLDALNTNLVVADSSRTDKTICLAVSPSLKSYGISGRPRLFEVKQKVKEINEKRLKKYQLTEFSNTSVFANELKNNPSFGISFLTATPQMGLYIKYSTKIYEIYLRYVSKEDIYVYSIDEVFIDLTHYLKTYQLDAFGIVMKMLDDVVKETGVTATAGVGTNLFLAKVAMDVEAKHVKPDKNGFRIAFLDEESYRQRIWAYQPITDIWRVGSGYANKLAKYGMYTMGDVALCSVKNEDLLYQLFGINAELLIDHAWGYEPVTMQDIKAYKPINQSLSTGQVLHCATPFETARLNAIEMIDAFSLDLVEKKLLTKKVGMVIIYDKDSLTNYKNGQTYQGEIVFDHYGWGIPKPVHGYFLLDDYTSQTTLLVEHIKKLFDRIVDKDLLVRKISISAEVIKERDLKKNPYEQLQLFSENLESKSDAGKEKKAQEAIIAIKKKFGKNSILKANNLEKGATMKERNNQIGGHKA